jgi:hypothetical protein
VQPLPGAGASCGNYLNGAVIDDRFKAHYNAMHAEMRKLLEMERARTRAARSAHTSALASESELQAVFRQLVERVRLRRTAVAAASGWPQAASHGVGSRGGHEQSGVGSPEGIPEGNGAPLTAGSRPASACLATASRLLCPYADTGTGDCAHTRHAPCRRPHSAILSSDSGHQHRAAGNLSACYSVGCGSGTALQGYASARARLRKGRLISARASLGKVVTVVRDDITTLSGSHLNGEQLDTLLEVRERVPCSC